MKRKQKAVYNNAFDIENKMRTLANALIDRVLEMTPEERQEIEKKIKKSKHYEKENNQ